jgi:hypothetical protein
VCAGRGVVGHYQFRIHGSGSTGGVVCCVVHQCCGRQASSRIVQVCRENSGRGRERQRERERRERETGPWNQSVPGNRFLETGSWKPVPGNQPVPGNRFLETRPNYKVMQPNYKVMYALFLTQLN